MVNFTAINTRPIDGIGYTTPAPGDVVTKGVGNLLTLENYVTLKASGSLFSIQQDVYLRISASGNLFSIENKVQNKGVGDLLQLQQLVEDATLLTFYQKFGYYPIIIINGQRIPDDWVSGQFQIIRQENEAAQATFSLKNAPGLQDPNQYEGKAINIICLYAGQVPYLYVGYVNTPQLDLIGKTTTYTCTDLRIEKINASLGGVVPYVGQYLTEIFGTPEDLADELDKRLSQTTLTLDFNASGQSFFNDIMPKGSPDITYTAGDLYRGKPPQIEYAARSRIVNAVGITVTYQYTRCYQRELNFNWSAAYPSICEFLTQGYSICAKSTIIQAISSAGWPLKTIGYTPVLEGGNYNCGGGTIGWVNGNFNSSDLTRINDSSGNAVTDSNGNPTFNNSTAGSSISDANYCFGAGWSAATRFVQNISEVYNLSVYATQSILKYGQITQTENIGLTDNYDSSAWETFPAYQNKPAGGVQEGIDYHIDQSFGRDKLYQAFQIALNRANSTILRSHRWNTVTFSIPFNPYIELNHTIALNCALSHNDGALSAIGKVMKITHTLGINAGSGITEIVIANTRSIGSASPTGFPYPAIPSQDYESSVRAQSLGSIYGSPTPANFVGFVGNKFINTVSGTTTNYARTNYTESFTVKVPEIEGAVRNTRTLITFTNYVIAIPNYTLNVTYGTS